MVGTVLGPFPSFAGITIHIVDRIVSFNPTDAIFLRITFLTEAGIDAGTGGVDYLSGNWKITGGTGVFSGLSGQGTAVNAFVFNTDALPPPDYLQEELVGWLIR